jgi:hypothetical protein
LYELATRLRAPVAIYDPWGLRVWWGYVNRVEIGGQAYTWGVMLDDVFNLAQVAYSYTAPGSEAAERRTTAAASDATSQAVYGVKETLLNGGDQSDVSAVQLRDTQLALHKIPQGVVEFSSSEQAAVIECKGWWHTLGWRMASWPSVAALTFSTNTADQAIGDAAGSTRGMQQFTVGSQAINVLSVEVYLRKSGAPADNLTVEIFALAAGVPTGSALTSGTLAGGSITTSNAWVSVAVTEVELAADTLYGLVVRRSGANDAANYYIWRLDTGLGYAGGAFRLWNGSAWVARGTDADGTFRILVNNQVLGGTQMRDLTTTYGQFVTEQVWEVSASATPALASYRDGDTTARTEIELLMAAGTTNLRRVLARIDAERRVIWSEEPANTNVQYLLHRDGRLTRTSGGEVLPYAPTVGVWVRLADVPKTADGSGLIDASLQYMNAAEWAPGDGLKPVFRGNRGVEVFSGSGSTSDLKALVRGWTETAGNYTPEWTAATSNPAIGDGTLEGRYVQRGKTCLVNILLVAGSTTTFGSGAWSFSLPFQASYAVTTGGWGWRGVAAIYDSSAGQRFDRVAGINRDATTVSQFVAMADGTTALTLTSAAPMTWASGDILSLQAEYEIK